MERALSVAGELYRLAAAVHCIGGLFISAAFPSDFRARLLLSLPVGTLEADIASEL